MKFCFFSRLLLCAASAGRWLLIGSAFLFVQLTGGAAFAAVRSEIIKLGGAAETWEQGCLRFLVLSWGEGEPRPLVLKEKKDFQPNERRTPAGHSLRPSDVVKRNNDYFLRSTGQKVIGEGKNIFIRTRNHIVVSPIVPEPNAPADSTLVTHRTLLLRLLQLEGISLKAGENPFNAVLSGRLKILDAGEIWNQQGALMFTNRAGTFPSSLAWNLGQSITQFRRLGIQADAALDYSGHPKENHIKDSTFAEQYSRYHDTELFNQYREVLNEVTAALPNPAYAGWADEGAIAQLGKLVAEGAFTPEVRQANRSNFYLYVLRKLAILPEDSVDAVAAQMVNDRAQNTAGAITPAEFRAIVLPLIPKAREALPGTKSLAAPR